MKKHVHAPKPSSKNSTAKPLNEEHKKALTSLPPNFDLEAAEYLFDNWVLPVFLYGTLASGQAASNYLDHVLAPGSHRATLHNHKLYVHSRTVTINGIKQTEYFPYAYEETWDVPVQGRLHALKPKNNRGKKRIDIIKDVDEYEEVSSGLFVRKIVSVDVSGVGSVLALAYVGTHDLKSRGYIKRNYPHQVHEFHEDEEEHIESGDFAAHKQAKKSRPTKDA